MLLLRQYEVSQFLGDELRRRHAVLGDRVEAEEAVGQARQDVDLDLSGLKLPPFSVSLNIYGTCTPLWNRTQD